MSETSEAIIHVLLQDYMPPPETEVQWKNIAQKFGDLWQFPHVVGAIDGKHVVIEAPTKSGTLYHNYKGIFSIVLPAVCAAKYKNSSKYKNSENSLYTSQGFIDVELADGKIKEGEWRSQVGQDICLKLMKPPKGARRKVLVNELRENLNHFVNSEIGSVPWQFDYVKSVWETGGEY